MIMPLEPPLKIAVTRERDFHVISLKGYLDISTYPLLENTLMDLFNRRHYRFIIDCTELEYLNCRGVGTLIGAFGIAQEQRGRIVLANPNRAVRELWGLLELQPLLPLMETMSKARSALVSGDN